MQTTEISPNDCALDMEGVCAITTCSRPYIYRLVATNRFPPPKKLGRKNIWMRSTVLRWLHEQSADEDKGLDPVSPEAMVKFGKKSLITDKEAQRFQAGRPSVFPCALAHARPALTRSWIIARSNSAKTPFIPNIALHASVVSMPC